VWSFNPKNLMSAYTTDKMKNVTALTSMVTVMHNYTQNYHQLTFSKY